MNATASHAEHEASRAASLRRIAIVLSSLPKPVASKLMSELGTEARRRVRQELINLVDVDPLERKRALESFTGTVKRQAAGSDDQYPSTSSYETESVDEATFSAASRMAAGNPAHARNASSERSASSPHPTASHQQGGPEPATSSSSLGFLDRVNDDDLMSLLQNEHPQTKAVVLASIDPARAAQFLPRMTPNERQDMLSRIGRLQALPEEMLADLASSFQSRVEQMQSARNVNPLQQLLNEHQLASTGWDSSNAAQHVPATAAAVSPRLQAILAEMPTASTPNTTHHHSESGVDPNGALTQQFTSSGPNTSGHNTGNVTSRSPDNREAEQAGMAADRLRRITRDEGPSTVSQATPAPTTPETGMSTDDVHRELVQLPARKLCEALGRVDTRVAILALCGLPNQTADAAIGCLPRTQAKQVRQHLMSVGSMEIREIDRAKDLVAQAAQVRGRVEGTSDTKPATVAGPSAAASNQQAMAVA
ncbi:FliG C-terminal domain-containing protein [Neorhodopirellula lusitana]|uniref:FliG C-terminal domain-containing protein n=1 Tax=Neorhodopirellula lusitana TaxID=445327 RepID=UPI00384D94BB